LTATAVPNGARVRDPVVPEPAKYIVSVVIAIVMVAPVAVLKEIVKPIGRGTVALSGSVTVRVAVA
jgi:hypothetical protein